jgi:hypothetical protein
MNQTADSFRGDGVIYERGRAVAKVNAGATRSSERTSLKGNAPSWAN